MAGRKPRTDLDDPIAPPPVAPLPKPSRFFRRLFLLVGAVGLLVALAPTIVCHSPLLARLIAWGTTDLRGQVSVGDTSLGWFSPLNITSFELSDDAGRAIVRADRVSNDRTLWNLANRPSQLGRLRIERPQIDLVVFDDGTTNVEQLLEKYLHRAASPTSASGVDLACEIIDGTLTIHDHATQRRWTIGRLNTVVVVPGDPSAPLVFDVKGAVAEPDGPKQLAAQGSWRSVAAASGSSQPQGDAAVSIEALPLELAYSLVRRFLPGLDVSGRLHGNLHTRFDFAAPRPTADAAGRLGIVNLAVGATSPAGDEVRLKQVDVPLRAVLDGDRLQLDEFGAACDLASLTARGSIEPYQRVFDVAGMAQLLDLLTLCDGEASAKFDLARIARAMPHVLRLHDDVNITGGDVTLNASGQGRPGARRWNAELLTSRLAAERGGRPIVWDQPLRGVVTAHEDRSGPVVDHVQCASDFLTVDGTNGPQSFELTAEYDLAKLGARLVEFVDLAGIQMRGNGTAQATWQRAAAERFNVDGQAIVNDFGLAVPQYPVWTEKQLILGLQASGHTAGLAVTSLDTGAVGLKSGSDELTVRLAQPVADARRPDVVWPLQVEGQGESASWLARLRPFLGLPPDAVAEGRITLNAAGRVRLPDDFEITQSHVTATPFRWAAYGVVIDEPTGDLQLSGRYRPDEITIGQATLVSPGVQSQVRQLVWRSAVGKPSELSGDASLKGDAAKLWRMCGGGPTRDGLQLGGSFEGSTRLQTSGAAVTAAIDAVVQNLVVAQPGGAAWREPFVKLSGNGVYDFAADVLTLSRVDVAADALRAAFTGGVSQLMSTRVVQCSGNIDYDLAKLTPLAQSYLGTGVAFEGRSTDRFELTGPLSDPTRGGAVPWEKLDGAARVGWNRANLYGLQIGKGALDGRLNQGLLRVNPLDLAVNTGRVRLAPALRLGPGPMELSHEPGTVVDHVSITPEMANERMKYVFPIFAGVAQASGQFSLALDELRLPLDNPAAGSIVGRMTVHSVDVGPGLLTQEFAALLQQPLTIALARESVVDFKMIQGRIYHQNLEFGFPGAKVRTYGSVGLDQTLSMMAEVPLPQLPGRPILGAAATAQTVRIPIGGTLQAPQLDRNAFVQAAAQSVQQATQGALEQGINRGLERLLGPGALAPAPGTTNK